MLTLHTAILPQKGLETIAVEHPSYGQISYNSDELLPLWSKSGA